nr:uncharacterized protein LOC111506492 [Leptinotarsa decemlineata]
MPVHVQNEIMCTKDDYRCGFPSNEKLNGMKILFERPPENSVVESKRGVMAMHVQNETKCVKDDYRYGFPSNEKSNELKNVFERPLEKSAVESIRADQASVYDIVSETDDDPWLHFNQWKANRHVTRVENADFDISTTGVVQELKPFSPRKEKCQATESNSLECSKKEEISAVSGPTKEMRYMNANESQNSETSDPWENSSESWYPDQNEILKTQSESSDSISSKASQEIVQENGEKKYLKGVSYKNTNCQKKIIIHDNILIKEGCGMKQYKNSNEKIVECSLRKGRVWDKKDRCLYCNTDVTNFSRHLFRKHAEEESVQKILSQPKGKHSRKKMIELLRKQGNFSMLNSANIVRPVQRPSSTSRIITSLTDFLPCKYCKGLYKSKSLKRHAKICEFNTEKNKQLKYASEGQTMIAFNESRRQYLDRLRLKSEVFHTMQADRISLNGKSDTLICQYAENYLRKHKRPHIKNAVSNKVRELGRLLIPLQDIYGIDSMLEAFKPENYDKVVAATRIISGYDDVTRTFKAPSLAMHMRTSLLAVGSAAKLLLLKKDPILPVTNYEESLKNVKRFVEIVESNWKYAMGSLALKDLNEKHSSKPQTLPVTEDIILFQNYTQTIAETSLANLKVNCEDIKSYKNLTEASLALTILLNRKRVGDVQYIKQDAYNLNVITTNKKECLNVLTENEIALSNHFKRIITVGKGSKAVPVLFSRKLQEYVNTLLSIRRTSNFVPEENPFLFALTGSRKKWVDGSSILRKYATNCGAKNPSVLTSSRLRKQIATVLQILNLNETEMEQVASFMGHTKKTHEEFYRLPQDVFQTAKIAKLLLMMEKGVGAENKGRTLNEIDMELEMWNNVDMKPEITRSNSIEYSSQHSETVQDQCDEEEHPKDVHSASTIAEKFIEEPVKKEIALKRTSTKQSTRGTWTAKQKSIMISYFRTHLKNKIAPKKAECIKLINERPDLFIDKKWVQIKTFIYNTYRLP